MTFYLWFIDLMNITGVSNLNEVTFHIKTDLSWVLFDKVYEEIEFRSFLKMMEWNRGRTEYDTEKY
jgi:hypothetical protein